MPIDLGDKSLQTALLYDKKRQVLLAVYLNPTGTDRLLKGNVRDALNGESTGRPSPTCSTRSAGRRSGT